MNAEHVLLKVGEAARLYEPAPEEQTIIEFLHNQGLIMKVQEGKIQGYHITINGVKWRYKKFNRYQGAMR